MARINRAQHEVAAPETVVTLASLGLICCMVVTVVGIKIWWFKHRLSFDQSSTSNGAVGGTQPRIVTRTRSSKDKRLSQQFREPVLVHGVFRKREEDELETIERPKLLPPIRHRKFSQSTPELFQPPMRPALKQVAESEFLDIPAPPTREPPVPPTRQAPALFTRQAPEPPTSPSPASPTFEQNEATSIISSAFTEEPEIKAVEFHSSEEEEDIGENEFIRADIPQIKDQQEQETRVPKPLKRNRSYNLEGVERRFLRAKTPSSEKCKPGVNLMERRATGFQRPDEQEWQQFQEDEVDHGSDDRPANYSRRDEGKLRKWEDLESYSDEMVNLEPHHFDIQHFNNKSVVFQVVDVADEYEEEQEHYSTWTLKRRPTGYTAGAPKQLTDLDSDGEEPQQQQPQLCLTESDKLWQEMERDIDRDFVTNIEEEFNKIRHSYEANEEGFLEESTNELDTGYGKSIDEDWDNFEKLENFVSKIEPEKATRHLKVIKADLMESDSESLEKTPQQQKVHFNLSDDYKEEASDEETESRTHIRQRRPTEFERSSMEITQEDLLEEDEVTIDRAYTVSFQLSDEEDKQEEEEATTAIKQRRPTGYAKRGDYPSLLIETDDEDGEEQEFEVEKLKTDAIIKPKPRQKVTFNFTTQVREHEIDEILADEEIYSEQPTPLQRMTKINNSSDLIPARKENTAALLFSTQVSAEYATADEGFNDSWSAIRLHRQLTDEFQQLTLQGEEERAAPKAAYRNPLAQLDATNRKEEFAIVAKPRNMRDMKKAQARQTIHVEQYDSSATDA